MKITLVLMIALCLKMEVGMGQASPAKTERVEAFLSHVPIWPPDGKLPPEYADKYFVYLDVATQEYVVSYPERLTTGKPDGGKRITFRFEPQFVVEPEISVSITKGPEDRFVYAYTLKNGVRATRPMRWFSLVATSTDDSIVLEHPTWRTYGVTAPAPNVAPQAGLLEGPELRLRANMGKFVSISNSDVAEPLAPGTVLNGLRVTSLFRPGITSAYSYTGLALRVPHELPIEVSDQITPLLVPEKNYKITLTIGPKFDPKKPPTADPIWIADDYRRGIRAFIYSGRLDKDSSFVKEIDSLLGTVVQSGTRIPFGLKSTPSSQLEQELATAVRLALAP